MTAQHLARGPRTRGSRVRAFGAVIGVLLMAVGVVTVVAYTTHPAVSSTASVARDMNGNLVQPDVQPVSAGEAAVAEPADGLQLQVPSVGLDVPLGSLVSVDGEITPPGFTSAYWVRDLGVSPDQSEAGTLYVVTHSLRDGGKGPGNFLIDVPNGRSAVAAGATITVGDDSYTVTQNQVVTKTDLATNTDVWTDTPGRLVLITCLQHADKSPSTDNLVITAQLTR